MCSEYHTVLCSGDDNDKIGPNILASVMGDDTEENTPKKTEVARKKKNKQTTSGKKSGTSSGKVQTKKKAKKDPNAPKKPKSGYMFFSMETRHVIKTENPDSTFAELGKLLGEAWQGLSDADKQPYTDAATEDKERYSKEKENYVVPTIEK